MKIKFDLDSEFPFNKMIEIHSTVIAVGCFLRK